MRKRSNRKARTRREWRKAARGLGISYRQIQMAQVLGWSLVRLRARSARGGRTPLVSAIENQYRNVYGKADPYSNPMTLKQRRRARQERRARPQGADTVPGEPVKEAAMAHQPPPPKETA